MVSGQFGKVQGGVVTHTRDPLANPLPGRDATRKAEQDTNIVADLASARSANDIARFADMVDQHRPSKIRPPLASSHDVMRQALAARRLLEISHQVDAVFETPLLANPAWDILLDLFIQRSDRKPISIISLCVTANAPTSTALRYIQAMLDSGAIVKTASTDDSQGLLVELSDTTYSMMQSILS